TDLRNKIVNVLVPKLKDNLQDTGSETTKHYRSVIKTDYNGNGKPYTHPIYLTNDLPNQI
ncbi:15302_t:CDS:2, partial [Funneliformis caledonium]